MKEIDPETSFIIKEKTGEDRSGLRDCSLAPTHGRCGLGFVRGVRHRLLDRGQREDEEYLDERHISAARGARVRGFRRCSRG